MLKLPWGRLLAPLKGLGLAFLLSAQVLAAPVLTFNTGVDNTRAPLSTDSPDSHWFLSSTGDANFASATVRANDSSSGFPIGPWVGDAADPDSRWISAYVSPTLDGFKGVGTSNSTYVFSTQFNLAAFDPASAILQGFYASDDATSIYLNGFLIGSGGGFTGFSNFGTIDPSHFVAGLNTLSFAVVNSGSGPFGVRVNYNVTANAVPELQVGSASLPLVLLMMLGLALSDRRYRSLSNC